MRNLKPAGVILLTFLGVIAVGTLLLALPFSAADGKSIGFVDALFTATSAVCVTGLVVRDTGSTFSFFGQLVILLLIQIGGLGIMTFATLFSLILGRKVNLNERIALQETVSDLSLSGIVRLFKHILILVFSVELIGALVLMIWFIPEFGVGPGIWHSIFLSVSAFSNAGFDILGTQSAPFVSLSGYQGVPLVLLPVMALFLIGGLGFITWRDIFTVRRFRDYMLHTKVVLITTGALILGGVILLLALEWGNTLEGMDFPKKILNAFFHTVAPRTAGFNTLDVASLRPASQFLTLFLMFIGAAPGSTAGGIKITTFAIILATLLSYFRNRQDVHLLNRKVNWNVVRRALSILFVSLTLVFISTFVLLVAEEGTLSQVLFESVSAFGTVGLSTGITPGLSTLGKLMLVLTMFMGRLGPLTVALTITFASHAPKHFTYPEGKISVG